MGYSEKSVWYFKCMRPPHQATIVNPQKPISRSHLVNAILEGISCVYKYEATTVNQIFSKEKHQKQSPLIVPHYVRYRPHRVWSRYFFFSSDT